MGERTDSGASAASSRGSWLCPTELDRARLLDMTARIMPASAAVGLICAPVSALLVARVGAVFFLPFAVITAFIAVGARLARRPRAEYWLFGGDCLVAASIAAAVALTGGAHSPCLPTLLLPLVAVAGRHTRRALFLYFPIIVAFTLAAAALAINQQVSFEDLLVPSLIGTMASLLVLMLALMRADSEHHRASLIDPLTGLFNRLALARKFHELAEQSLGNSAGLCVIAADIDHFKDVNDSHGHARGDQVLRMLAEELRSHLRAFSLVYRTGGEEFAVVLPGLDVREGHEIAERLRADIERANIDGLAVTMSFGVAATPHLEFDPELTLQEADEQLYAAKRAGRNRVIARLSDPPPAGARTTPAARSAPLAVR